MSKGRDSPGNDTYTDRNSPNYADKVEEAGILIQDGRHDDTYIRAVTLNHCLVSLSSP